MNQVIAKHLQWRKQKTSNLETPLSKPTRGKLLKKKMKKISDKTSKVFQAVNLKIDIIRSRIQTKIIGDNNSNTTHLLSPVVSSYKRVTESIISKCNRLKSLNFHTPKTRQVHFKKNPPKIATKKEIKKPLIIIDTSVDSLPNLKSLQTRNKFSVRGAAKRLNRPSSAPLPIKDWHSDKIMPSKIENSKKSCIVKNKIVMGSERFSPRRALKTAKPQIKKSVIITNVNAEQFQLIKNQNSYKNTRRNFENLKSQSMLSNRLCTTLKSVTRQNVAPVASPNKLRHSTRKPENSTAQLISTILSDIQNPPKKPNRTRVISTLQPTTVCLCSNSEVTRPIKRKVRKNEVKTLQNKKLKPQETQSVSSRISSEFKHVQYSGSELQNPASKIIIKKKNRSTFQRCRDIPEETEKEIFVEELTEEQQFDEYKITSFAKSCSKGSGKLIPSSGQMYNNRSNLTLSNNRQRKQIVDARNIPQNIEGNNKLLKKKKNAKCKEGSKENLRDALDLQEMILDYFGAHQKLTELKNEIKETHAVLKRGFFTISEDKPGNSALGYITCNTHVSLNQSSLDSRLDDTDLALNYSIMPEELDDISYSRSTIQLEPFSESIPVNPNPSRASMGSTSFYLSQQDEDVASNYQESSIVHVKMADQSFTENIEDLTDGLFIETNYLDSSHGEVKGDESYQDSEIKQVIVPDSVDTTCSGVRSILDSEINVPEQDTNSELDKERAVSKPLSTVLEDSSADIVKNSSIDKTKSVESVNTAPTQFIWKGMPVNPLKNIYFEEPDGSAYRMVEFKPSESSCNKVNTCESDRCCPKIVVSCAGSWRLRSPSESKYGSSEEPDTIKIGANETAGSDSSTTSIEKLKESLMAVHQILETIGSMNNDEDVSNFLQNQVCFQKD